MSLENWLAFVAASAILLAIPGPTILLVISYALGHGRKVVVDQRILVRAQREVEALEAQLSSGERIETVATNARDRLRLLDARLDEAVARAQRLIGRG